VINFLVVLLMIAQQSLPSAPEPKPTPTPSPFHLHDNDAPPQSSDSPSSASAVTKEALSAPDRLALHEFMRQRVQPTIRRHWEALIPQSAKAKHTWYGTVKDGKVGVLEVTFTIHRDGSITDIKLEDSSGDDQLDRAALQAIKESAPLPLPGSFKKDAVRINSHFLYSPKHPAPAASP